MNSYSCRLPFSKESKQVESLSALLKLVSEESRLKILCILHQEEHCVCEIMEQVDMSQSLVSHHLKDLKDAGIVSDEKKNLKVYYSLTDKGRKITSLMFKVYKEVIV